MKDSSGQQSQPRSSTARASGFEPEDLGSTPSGASNFFQRAHLAVSVSLILMVPVLFLALVTLVGASALTGTQEVDPCAKYNPRSPRGVGCYNLGKKMTLSTPRQEEPDVYTVMCIRWVDITGDGGWITKDELPEPAKITSCGIYVDEDEENLWLAMDLADDGDYNGTGVFPLGVIKDRIEVEVSFKE